MEKDYRSRTFKSGNSVALRLPKKLGISEGVEMRVREVAQGYAFEPVEAEPKRIDLTGIAGAIPGLKLERPPFDEVERDWEFLKRDG